MYPLFQLRRAVLAFGSESAEDDSHVKGTSETKQARSRSRHVVTSARPLQELYAHDVTAKQWLYGRLLAWITHTQGARMVEPMRPDPAEAVQCSRFRQLSRLTQVQHAQPARSLHIGGSP